MFRNKSGRGAAKREERKKEFDSPMDELNYLLDFLDQLINESMEDYIESIRPPSPEGKLKRPGVLGSLKKLRNRNPEAGPITPPRAPSSGGVRTPSRSVSSTPVSSAPNSGAGLPLPQKLFGARLEQLAESRFMPLGQEIIDDFVETIRRIAELVIIGERSHAKNNDSNESTEYLAIFETFFERQGLATITNILTGVSFDLRTHPLLIDQPELPLEDTEKEEDDGVVRKMPINMEEHQYMLLPPLPIATQAIQSVSILVQNVSRATSLFFILSNNHVNELIDVPLEKYDVAERFKQNREANDFTPRRFASPEMAELTTHFVTFLKSLALRMNAETLQFFLTYPADMAHREVEDIIVEDSSPLDESPQDDGPDDEDRPMDEVPQTAKPNRSESQRPVSIKTVKVKFPLYERALDFCSVHHDSFVRVTAMNICLNTLRIATVTPSSDGTDDVGPGEVGKSPDGVLHNAKPLPLKERVAIAQYVCTPARVERLASPIFTKLAQFWGILEEQFRDIDSVAAQSNATEKGVDSGNSTTGRHNGKLARAKEQARRQKASDAFSDTAYNVQDELLLLEDVLKVGLTSLNEQMIEMMFATFVYPLLLQPLLLYFQRSNVPNEVLFADPLNGHFAGRHIMDSDLTATENSIISAPAKSACFCLAAAFQFLTNPSLLRLLFTAIFHPLAPQATGETMIQAKADVACYGPDGKVEIRIDPIDEETGNVITPTDRSTYGFGVITGRKCYSQPSQQRAKDDTSCIFVLAPALAEILEYRGEDGALIAQTRPNPYRKAIFQCFGLCSQLSDLQPLSVLAVEAAVSKFPPKFLSEILFGLDIKKFSDKQLPVNPISASYAEEFDDRDIGGGTIAGESRLSLGGLSGVVGYNHMEEVISAFRNCTMKAVPSAKGTWKLEYDMVAAHALLCSVRGSSNAILQAAKAIETRCRQAAAFLSDIPPSVERFGGTTLSDVLNGIDKNPRDAEKINAKIMDIIFRGYGDLSKSPSVLNDLIELKGAHRIEGGDGYAVSVSDYGSYALICKRCCFFTPLDAELAEGALRSAMASARAWVKLDALSAMLNACISNQSSRIQEIDVIGGFAMKRDGSLVTTKNSNIVHSQISEYLSSALFGFDENDSGASAKQGSIVSLIGQTAFPSVCEVPQSSASLFSEESAKTVSQGITWQSLYLVVLGRHFLLAEPERRSGGDGRVVTTCPLERIRIQRDAPDARSDTSARRLMVAHDGPNASPPGLFLLEAVPSVKDEGPFVNLQLYRSALDVWFEDNRAVSLAFKKVEESIDEAVTYRGKRLQRFLSQEEDSAWPRNSALS